MNFEVNTLYANRWIVEKKLVELTWGNVSLKDSKTGNIYIKPSGVSLDFLSPFDISKIDKNGLLVSGKNPSVDTPSHLSLYKNFKNINCIIHTHSKYATIFAQAGMSVPCLGTTHADYFYGDVPCVKHPAEDKVTENYEKETGEVIHKWFTKNKINPDRMKATLVKGHGVFCWGSDLQKTLERAYVLELISEMAYKTLLLNPNSQLEKFILDKHFLRKHGNNKYYGQ